MRGIELPADSIAIRYRTPEEARRRAEAWEERGGETNRSRRTPTASVRRADRNEVVPHVDDLTGLLGHLLGTQPGEAAEHPGRLGLLDPHSGEVTLIPAALRGSFPLAWSADRSRLLFAQPEVDDFQLHEYDRDDETVRPVTFGLLQHTQGCYGPEGRIVVAAFDLRSEPAESHIAISSPGGRGPYGRLSPGPLDYSPTCAPDGSGVAYVSQDAAGRERIILHAPVLEGEARAAARGQTPSYSPDGQWIVFSAPVGKRGPRGEAAGWQLWRMRADGSGRAPVGRGQRDEAQPAFSPDAQWVVYVAAEQLPFRHLYLRRFDGTGDRILFSNGDAEYPVW